MKRHKGVMDFKRGTEVCQVCNAFRFRLGFSRGATGFGPWFRTGFPKLSRSCFTRLRCNSSFFNDNLRNRRILF